MAWIAPPHLHLTQETLFGPLVLSALFEIVDESTVHISNNLVSQNRRSAPVFRRINRTSLHCHPEVGFVLEVNAAIQPVPIHVFEPNALQEATLEPKTQSRG